MRGAVVVVGGCGFIGSHLVERLASDGVAVRAVSRSGHWSWGRRPQGVTFHPVDLDDPDATMRLAPVVAGASAVVNLAGVLYRPTVPKSAYSAVHVEGLRRMLEAVELVDEPVRFVQVSTTGVLGPTGTGPLDESAPLRPSTVYERTKAEAERMVLRAAEGGRDVVVLRPGLVYGPRDLHLLALFRSVASGSFRTIGGGRASWQPIHVSDVVEGIVATLRIPGASRQVFHLAGAETITLRRFAARIAEALGTRLRGPDLPVPLAVVAGVALETLYRPFGVDPPLSRSRVATMTRHRRYAIDHARDVLGVMPRIGLDEGIPSTVAWYRQEGLLDA